MNNINTTGYTDGAQTEKNGYNIIPGRNITMQGVSKHLTLVPIVGGKPQYDRKRIAKPGDADIEFESDVEGVLELPNAQVGMNTTNGGFDPFKRVTNTLPQIDTTAVDNLTPAIGFGYGDSTGFDNPLYNGVRSQTMNQGVEDAVEAGNFESADIRNIRQQVDAEKIQAEQKKNNGFKGAPNPYGGWNMQNTASFLGASIQNKDTLGIIGSSGKLLLEGARHAFAGAGAVNTFTDAQSEYDKAMQEALSKEGEYNMQKGGRVGKLLTGNFLQGDDNHPDPNIEMERGEYAQTPDGNTMEVLGKRHSKGGETFNMPGGTKVVSDYLKIGSELATYFKKEYGINVKSGSTFATVLDKYKQKIGLTELLEDEAKLMKKIADQEKVSFESTREINLQVLSEKVTEIQSEKAELEDKFNSFTNLVFDKQESSKQEGGDNYEKQEGGNVEQQEQQGQELDVESQIQQLIEMYSQITGQDPQELITQLQKMNEQQLEQAVQQMTQVIQEAQQQGQPQQEEQPMMQMGGEQPQEGGGEMEQIMQMIAEQLQQGVSPDELVQALMQQGASQEEATQLVQQVISSLQGSQEQPQQEEQPMMRKGGRINSRMFSNNMYYAQEGLGIPLEGDPLQGQNTNDNIFEQESGVRTIEKDGQTWAIYGSGNNTRMVPIKATQNNPASPYNDGSWEGEQYSSDYQGQILASAKERYSSSPGDIKSINKTDEAERVQQVLIDSGYDIGKHKKDGIIGRDTKSAMRKMQAEDPETYRTWINLIVEPEPVSAPRAEAVSSTKAEVKKKGVEQAKKTEAKKPKTPTAIKTPIVTKTSSTPTVEKTEVVSGPKVLNNKYYNDTNRVLYNGKTYTPNQLLQDVKRMEADPMFSEGSISEKMISLLNAALYKNKKPLHKSAAFGYGNWKDQNNYNYSSEEARRKDMKYQDGGVLYAQAGGSLTKKQYKDLEDVYTWDPTYDYGSLEEEAKAIIPFLERNGIEYKPGDLKTQEGMDRLAGLTQNKFRTGYKPVSDHYSSQVASTQTGLQTALDNKLITSDELISLGVKVKDGKILRGSKGIVPKDNEQKVVDIITTNGKSNPDAYTKYVDTNFVDNKWYFRNPNVQTVDFDSKEEMDDFTKDYTIKMDNNGEAIYYSNKQGLYFKPQFKGTPVKAPEGTEKVEDTKPTDGKSDIGTFDAPGAPKTASAMRAPDQSNLPPIYLPTSMKQLQHTQANTIHQSPLEILKELSRQSNTANNIITSTNPYTSGSAMANLQAQQADSANKAFAQINSANQQDERNVANINEERIMGTATNNSNLAGQYEKEQIVGLDNFYDEWKNFIDNSNRVNVANWNLQNQQNAANAVNPNYQIGADGSIQQTDQPFKLFDPNGNIMGEYNPKTKKFEQIIKKDAQGKVIGSVEKTKTGKKGGMLLSKLPKYK